MYSDIDGTLQAVLTPVKSKPLSQNICLNSSQVLALVKTAEGATQMLKTPLLTGTQIFQWHDDVKPLQQILHNNTIYGGSDGQIDAVDLESGKRRLYTTQAERFRMISCGNYIYSVGVHNTTDVVSDVFDPVANTVIRKDILNTKWPHGKEHLADVNGLLFVLVELDDKLTLFCFDLVQGKQTRTDDIV